VRNGSFEEGKAISWRISGRGDWSAEIGNHPPSGNRLYLAVKVGDIKGALGTLNHPDLSNARLVFEPGRMYRFAFRWMEENADSSIGGILPLRVRVTYSDPTVEGKKKYHYEWFAFPSVDGWRSEQLVLISPDPARFTQADITLFFYRKGSFGLDEVFLEPW